MMEQRKAKLFQKGKINTMKRLYIIQYPGIMGYEIKRLTGKQAEALRAEGYTVIK